jgi:hypothetical protein
MLLGDNGEQRVDEIDLLEVRHAGRNYGWNIFEGTECYLNNSRCDDFSKLIKAYFY